MKTLSIDIETFSSVDLGKSGVFKYVESPDFQILLFAYKYDNTETQVVDIASGENLPPQVLEDLTNPQVLKTAFNAVFEITCIDKWLDINPNLNIQLDPTQWEDTMFRAAYASYTGGLKQVAEALNFEKDKQKDARGTNLIKKFSQPRKPTKNNKNTRLYPTDDIISWQEFKEYNRQDVEVEYAIREALKDIKIPEKEKEGWLLDLEIQRRGVGVDIDLVDSALNLDKSEKGRLTHELQLITGLNNPGSVKQMKEWLSQQLNKEVKSLTKDTVPQLIQECQEKGLKEVELALKLRQELAKTSLSKYAKIKDMVCEDGRVHGILQFYGSRTGRWAGRGVQVQNLPRNYLVSIEAARSLFKGGYYEGLSLIYGSNLSDTASQLIRTSFIPKPGKMFAVADYSAIEARVIAWLSGEEWRLNVFRTTGKIYEESAAQLFNVPFEKICDKNAPEHSLRSQGKVAELALGYQGAVNAIEKFDPGHAIPLEDRPRIVKQWRKKSPCIVQLWRDCEQAAIKAIKNPGMSIPVKCLIFKCENDYLTITLPSKRKLYYPEPRLGVNPYGRDSFDYKGLIQESRKIGRVYMYGGKLVENVTQAVARDCLAESLLKLNKAGYEIDFHVHDEVIIEVNKENAKEELDRIIEIMCEQPTWAKELPLNAAGFVSEFYMKD